MSPSLAGRKRKENSVLHGAQSHTVSSTKTKHAKRGREEKAFVCLPSQLFAAAEAARAPSQPLHAQGTLVSLLVQKPKMNPAGCPVMTIKNQGTC